MWWSRAVWSTSQSPRLLDGRPGAVGPPRDAARRAGRSPARSPADRAAGHTTGSAAGPTARGRLPSATGAAPIAAPDMPAGRHRQFATAAAQVDQQQRRCRHPQVGDDAQDSLSVLQCRDTGQDLAFKKLQRGAAAS